MLDIDAKFNMILHKDCFDDIFYKVDRDCFIDSCLR